MLSPLVSRYLSMAVFAAAYLGVLAILLAPEGYFLGQPSSALDSSWSGAR